MSRRAGNTGPIGLWIAGGVVLVAYLIQPALFHNFFHWVIESIFDGLSQATGNDVESPVNSDQGPGTITDPNGGGGK